MKNGDTNPKSNFSRRRKYTFHSKGITRASFSTTYCGSGNASRADRRKSKGIIIRRTRRRTDPPYIPLKKGNPTTIPNIPPNLLQIIDNITKDLDEDYNKINEGTNEHDITDYDNGKDRNDIDDDIDTDKNTVNNNDSVTMKPILTKILIKSGRN